MVFEPDGLQIGIGNTNTKRFVYNKDTIKKVILPDLIKYLIGNYGKNLQENEICEKTFKTMFEEGPRIDAETFIWKKEDLETEGDENIDIYAVQKKDSLEYNIQCGNLINYLSPGEYNSHGKQAGIGCMASGTKKKKCTEYAKKLLIKDNQLGENEKIQQHINSGLIKHYRRRIKC